MARPSKPARSRKARTIIFRVTESEYARLEQIAAAAGVRVNDLARDLSLSRTTKIRIEKVDKADPALLKRLDRLGNNLNQLAMRSHLTGRVPASLKALCDRISDIVLEAAEREWDDGA